MNASSTSTANNKRKQRDRDGNRLSNTAESVLWLFSMALVAVVLQGALFYTTWQWQHQDHIAACPGIGNSQQDINIPMDIRRNSTNEKIHSTKVKKPSSSSSPYLTEPDAKLLNMIPARSFRKWPQDRELPCFQGEEDWWKIDVQRSPAHEGFLMMKEMKTGGSSAAGVNLRIARNVAIVKHGNKKVKPCKMRNDHALAYKMEYHNREKERSYLWTTIREPTKRTVSQFFHFEVSRAKVEPNDKNFQKYVTSVPTTVHYYIRTLTMKEQISERGPGPDTDPVQEAHDILQDYDFIGITERMEESIVALQMLLGLSTADILYLNAKGSGGFDDGAANMICRYIVPSFVSPGMKEFFSGPLWQSGIRGDLALYHAANRSLDKTIDEVLGRDKFDEQLRRFHNAQERVQEFCIPKIKFPCSAGGDRQLQTGCLWSDSGCGTGCIDHVAKEMGLFTKPELF